MDHFLISVQRRALQMARISVGNNEDALEIVQESMLQLVRRYGDRSWDEWRILFYRILQNRIRDLYRRQKVRNAYRGFLSQGGCEEDGKDEIDPFQNVADPARHESPEGVLERREEIGDLYAAVKSLPVRQQQAFMLRCWEGLNTRDTARAMNCTEGSVKTHYSRALEKLRTQLEEHRP